MASDTVDPTGLEQAVAAWSETLRAAGGHAGDQKVREAFGEVKRAVRAVEALYAQQLLDEHGIRFE